MRQLKLLIALIGTTGCAGIVISGGGWPSGYSGPECSRERGGKPLVVPGNWAGWVEVSEEQSAEAQTLSILCGQQLSLGGNPVVGGARLALRLHEVFDDRRPDALAAARMLIFCVAGDLDGTGREKNSACSFSPRTAGLMQLYSEMLSDSALDASLRALDISDDGRAYFVRKTKEAQAMVQQLGAQLKGRERALYVQLPATLRAQRQALFAKHAALYQRLDAAIERARTLPPGAPVATVAAELTALRGEYFAQCKDASCKLDPFVTDATRELVQLHVLANDATSAELEWSLISEEHANLRGFAQSLYLERNKALNAEQSAFRAYSDAVESRMDERLRLAKFGDPPPIDARPDDSVWAPKFGFPGLNAAMQTVRKHGRPAFVSGKVRAVERAADKSRIVFADEVSITDVMDCRATDRIARVNYQAYGQTVTGQVEYEQRCWQTGKKDVERRKTAPVLVTARETQRIRPGDVVETLVDATSREGGVVTVSRKSQVVQLRSHALP